jgi:ABC-type dipeptide/oligopeptide/nickel transport system ATPase component
MMPSLEVKNLRTQFKIDGGIVKAVDDVSYYINEKEIVGIAGGHSAPGRSSFRAHQEMQK